MRKKGSRRQKLLHNYSKASIQLDIRQKTNLKPEEEEMMALKETIKHMKELLNNITLDLEKAEAGNKAASQRVRTGTVRLEKIAKSYRKESIKGEKTPTRTKKPAAKKQPAKATAAKAKPAASAKAKAKPKASVAKARGRSLAIKRPTAKLPSHRSFR